MQDQEERRKSDERLPGNDESSRNNPISEEDAIPSDDVAEMHEVIRKSDWPDK